MEFKIRIRIARSSSRFKIKSKLTRLAGKGLESVQGKSFQGKSFQGIKAEVG
jgi:hypothetical protein